MSRTMGKPFAMSKCIMLAVCVVCAASVFMMAGCQTQGTTNGSQNAQSSASSGKTAGAVKGEPAPGCALDHARRLREKHFRFPRQRDYRELLGDVVPVLHQGNARFATDKRELSRR